MKGQPQRHAWRVFAAIGVIGAAAVGWGWGLTAGLLWFALWVSLAGFTYFGKINPVIVLLLLPVGADTQQVGLSAGWLTPGQLAGEPVNHVRIDPTIAHRMEIAFDRTDRWGGYFAVDKMNSYYYEWKAGTGKATWWDVRPVDNRLYAIDWTGIWLGCLYRPHPDVRLGVGGGALLLTTAYNIQGASPTTSTHLELSVRWDRPVHEGVRFGLECRAQPTLLFGHEWIRHGAARGLPSSERTRGNLVVPTFCGLGARVDL